jgi:hypothetical protein
MDIPVTPGKTYTMAINNPVVLSDLNNTLYGVFCNL